MIRIVHLLDDFAAASPAPLPVRGCADRRPARSTVVPLGQSMIAPRLDAEFIVLHVPRAGAGYPSSRRCAAQPGRGSCRSNIAIPPVSSGPACVRRAVRALIRCVAAWSTRSSPYRTARRHGCWTSGSRRASCRPSCPGAGGSTCWISPSAAKAGPLKLLSYGRSRRKNFGAMIDAVQRFPADRVQLVLFGAGPQGEALTRQAAATSNVTVLPPDSNPGPYLGRCDAVVLPSRHEAIRVATEARLAGRAVLVADVDGLPEQAAAGGGWRCRWARRTRSRPVSTSWPPTCPPWACRCRGCWTSTVSSGLADLIDRAQTKAQIAAPAAVPTGLKV